MPRLRTAVEVAADYETVRPLYERADGLAALTPGWLHLEFEGIEGPLAPLEPGSRFRVQVRPFGRGPVTDGVVEIVEASFDDDGGHVEDVLVDGPFDGWRHRRTLTPTAAGTRIEDDLAYRRAPAGSLGRLGAPLVLRAVFAERSRRLRRRFGRA